MRLLTVLFVSFLCLSSLSAQNALTNEQIVELTKTGVGEDVILTMVKSQPTDFSVGFPDIVALKKAGVADSVIKAMIQAGKEVSVAPSTPVASSAPAASVTVDDGLIPDRTLVKIAATQNISSKDAKAGDPVKFEVAEDVIVDDGTVVISKGTPVLCEIFSVLERQMIGVSGMLQIVAHSTKSTNGTTVPLSGLFTEGDAKVSTKEMVISSFPGVGLFRRGKHAEIKKGQTFNVYSGKEITISSP